jgi:hypothetical protein
MTYQLIDGRTALDIAKASGIGLGAVIKAAQLLKAKGIVN